MCVHTWVAVGAWSVCSACSSEWWSDYAIPWSCSLAAVQSSPAGLAHNPCQRGGRSRPQAAHQATSQLQHTASLVHNPCCGVRGGQEIKASGCTPSTCQPQRTAGLVCKPERKEKKRQKSTTNQWIKLCMSLVKGVVGKGLRLNINKSTSPYCRSSQ